MERVIGPLCAAMDQPLADDDRPRTAVVNKLTQPALLVLVGLAVLAAASPTLIKLIAAFVPRRALVLGVLAAVHVNCVGCHQALVSTSEKRKLSLKEGSVKKVWES